MLKPSSKVLRVANEIGEKIKQARNIDATIEKLEKERRLSKDEYIKDCLNHIKELGFTFSDKQESDTYTRFDMGHKSHSEFDHAVIVFRHDIDSGLKGFNAVINSNVGRYISEVTEHETSSVSSAFGGYEKAPNGINVRKKLDTMAELVQNLGKAYEIIETEYNQISTEVHGAYEKANNNLIEAKKLSSDELSIKGELMAVVADEVMRTFKGKSYEFTPTTLPKLISRIEKNKDFFFSMNGQSDTWGMRYAMNMHGDTERAYKTVLGHFMNSSEVDQTSKKILPFMVVKGGMSGFATKSVKVKSVAKNAKMDAIAVDSYDSGVLTNGFMESPKKKVSVSYTDEHSDVFVAKGGLLGILALWTNELDNYIKLF